VSGVQFSLATLPSLFDPQQRLSLSNLKIVRAEDQTSVAKTTSGLTMIIGPEAVAILKGQL